MLTLNDLTRKINARFNSGLLACTGQNKIIVLDTTKINLVEYEFGIADATAYFTCVYENADGLILNVPHITADLYEALAGQGNAVRNLLKLIFTYMNILGIEMSL